MLILHGRRKKSWGLGGFQDGYHINMFPNVSDNVVYLQVAEYTSEYLDCYCAEMSHLKV